MSINNWQTEVTWTTRTTRYASPSRCKNPQHAVPTQALPGKNIEERGREVGGSKKTMKGEEWETGSEDRDTAGHGRITGYKDWKEKRKEGEGRARKEKGSGTEEKKKGY